MDCTKLELYVRDLSGLQWRKSSRSRDDDPPDNCVEIAGVPNVVALRDSKDPGGPKLIVSRSDFRHLAETLKNL